MACNIVGKNRLKGKKNNNLFIRPPQYIVKINIPSDLVKKSFGKEFENILSLMKTLLEEDSILGDLKCLQEEE